MNLRQQLYLNYGKFRGSQFPFWLESFIREYKRGIEPATMPRQLSSLLLHCWENVPYYAQLLKKRATLAEIHQKPLEVLKRLPILTKDLLRTEFNDLTSTDLKQRKWIFNTSGGSTGVPVRFIQDASFTDRSLATAAFFNFLIGYEIGECEFRVWGSERDIFEGGLGWKAQLFNTITNTTFLNAFRMTPSAMRSWVDDLNRRKPRLIVAYAQAIYDFANFIAKSQLEVASPQAVVTSAGTLHAFMRHQIAKVFRCAVYNRYGSREVGAIACEVPGLDGLWVSPWCNFLEILDSSHEELAAECEGSIIVTSLGNYAMPLLRYDIGDRGALQVTDDLALKGQQILSKVSGRNVDTFKTPDGTLIDGEYFTHLLYFRDWVNKFQIIQRNHALLDIIVVKAQGEPPTTELNEIIEKCKLLLGKECRINFHFVNEILPSPSGKYRYTISEIP